MSLASILPARSVYPTVNVSASLSYYPRRLFSATALFPSLLLTSGSRHPLIAWNSNGNPIAANTATPSRIYMSVATRPSCGLPSCIDPVITVTNPDVVRNIPEIHTDTLIYKCIHPLRLSSLYSHYNEHVPPVTRITWSNWLISSSRKWWEI